MIRVPKRRKTRKTSKRRSNTETKTKKRKPKKLQKKTLIESSDDENASDIDGKGNVIDLIASDEEQVEHEHVDEPQNSKEELNDLLQSFPYDPSLLESDNSNVRRRSKRKRKPVERFFHKDYVKTFLTRGGKLTEKDVREIYENSDSDDDASGVNTASEDEDYEQKEEEIESQSEKDEEYEYGC